jgi:dolichyl-phosphate-mannose--protein O-mannosyl transferase
MAEQLARQGGAGTWNSPEGVISILPPMQFYVMALAEKIGLGATAGGLAFSFVFGLLFVLGSYLAAKELWQDERYALTAALLAAVFPPAIRYSVLILRDMPYWGTAMMAVAMGMRAVNRDRMTGWIWFALLTSLAVLIRREGVELFVGFALYLGWDMFKTKSWRRQIKVVITVTAVAIAVLTPVQLVQESYGSRWQILPRRLVSEVFQRIP